MSDDDTKRLLDSLTADPKALREHLVRLAMEAVRPYVSSLEPEEMIVDRIHERMAQAAQTIVAEVEALEIGDWLDGVGALNDKMRITGLTKERDEAIERAEKAESERDFQMLRADTMRQDAAEVSLLTDQRDEEPMPSDAVRRIVAERDAIVRQLAALHAAASEVVCDPCPFHDEDDCDETCREGNQHAGLRAAVADTAAAAEAHDREVRARVWEEADALLDAEGPGRVYRERRIRARAADERGER